ncbi:type IV secretory system conjugative DNA transfer family protein [Candidatus Gottesmanbacteria bacterium]|nr:type IV secretory system conjugative DNA transfer family protein [Candidatus Gottesmanbacteria bacterium]
MPVESINITFQLENFAIVFIALSILCVGIGLLFYLLFLLWKYRNREKQSLEFVLLQVIVPKENEVKIDAAEQFYSALASLSHGGLFSFLKTQDHIAFEIVGRPGDIRFYVSVHHHLRDLIEKQIYGMYPGAEIREVDEYNIFDEKGKVVFASFILKHGNHYPLKVFKDLPVDSMSAITSAVSKMQSGEGAAIQILITPASDKWKKMGKSYISNVKKNEANPEKAKYNVDPKVLESIENKTSKPGFNTVIRVVVSSATVESANMHLHNIESVFAQFASDQNHLVRTKHLMKSSFMVDFIYRYFPILNFPHRQYSVFSSEELATIFHFPNKTVETPHINWVTSKRAPAPANTPTSGLYFGKSVYRGLSRQIYMQLDDRRRHVYIIGKTGVGKSVLLKDMILQDIKAGHGVAAIDPHGDLVEGILPLIPPERAEDVIYFDPSDNERPMGLNMLEAYTEDQKHFIVTSIIGLMYKLYDPMKTGIIGPRFEHAIRNAMLTVMVEPGASFVEVVRVLTDASFVQELLPKVQDPIVRRYWTDQIAQTSDFHKSEVLDYIVSKFGRFVTNKTMRNIIGQSKSAFDFRKVMDEGKILLVNLAKGKLGEENSSFLGLILVPKILVAAMSRVDTPEEKRRDFFLYVDEFQNFATPDFAQILSEARKFRLNLCVANQFIGQMEEEVKNAVFGNVGTLVAFRVGVTDANYLQHWYTPVFTESDLINVDVYNAYVNTIVGNKPVPPFSVDMRKDMSAQKKMENSKVAEAILSLSRLKYGRPRELVEAEISQRAKL